MSCVFGVVTATVSCYGTVRMHGMMLNGKASFYTVQAWVLPFLACFVRRTGPPPFYSVHVADREHAGDGLSKNQGQI